MAGSVSSERFSHFNPRSSPCRKPVLTATTYRLRKRSSLSRAQSRRGRSPARCREPGSPRDRRWRRQRSSGRLPWKPPGRAPALRAAAVRLGQRHYVISIYITTMPVDITCVWIEPAAGGGRAATLDPLVGSVAHQGRLSCVARFGVGSPGGYLPAGLTCKSESFTEAPMAYASCATVAAASVPAARPTNTLSTAASVLVFRVPKVPCVWLLSSYLAELSATAKRLLLIRILCIGVVGRSDGKL